MDLQEAIDLLKNNNYLVETDINAPIRECTREEVEKAVCYTHYHIYSKEYLHLDQSSEKEILQRYQWAVEPYLRLYDSDDLLHAYTIDGNQCFLLIKPRSEYETTNYLALAYINPEARGTGLAARLLQKCIDDSPNGLRLDTLKDNVAMNKLAKKLGFKRLNKSSRSSIYAHYLYKKEI